MTFAEAVHSYTAVLMAISDERVSQIVEHGYDAAHDDAERNFQLLRAALAYGHHAHAELRGSPRPTGLPQAEWPWDAKQWSPKAPVETLIVMAALIVAEIERLKRLEAAS